MAVAGLALAAAAARRGDEALGFSLCAVTGLLVSPISWSHHWVIAIPALLVAGVAVGRAYRAGNIAAAALGAAGITTIAVIGWTGLALQVSGSDWLGLPPGAVARSVAYAFIGLAVLALAAGYQLCAAIRRPPQQTRPDRAADTVPGARTTVRSARTRTARRRRVSGLRPRLEA